MSGKVGMFESLVQDFARVVGEKTEMRAAITAYLAALDEFRKQEATLRALPEGMGIGQGGITAAYSLDDAEAALRRLAGGKDDQ